ncbi:MAG: acetyltransferase [Psychromonas sp.]|nr:acetyltransferase [Psychromonas sp.]
MFFKNRYNGDIIDVISLDKLTDSYQTTVLGRYQAGEELQEPEEVNKSDLLFLSGEVLPKCWIDPHYRDDKFKR